MRATAASIALGLLLFFVALPPVRAQGISGLFREGSAGDLSYQELVDSGVFVRFPMRGGVYPRKEAIRYIILHSTETASIADATRVIRSWSNRGERHPGAQFVVDRDGTIYSTTDPRMATVHINTNKCLAGYSNDNSIGIEIVRSGSQIYTDGQMDAVCELVTYLQQHYHIPDWNVTTHKHVQPSDRTDPVHFDWTGFELAKSELLRSAEIATETRSRYLPVRHVQRLLPPPPEVSGQRSSAVPASAEPDYDIEMPPAAPDIVRTLDHAPPVAPSH